LGLGQLEPRRIDERPPTEVATTDEEAPEREAGAASEAEPGAASANAAEEALEVAPAPEAVAEPEAEPEPLPEPAGLGIALGAAAEAALHAGDLTSGRPLRLTGARRAISGMP